VNYPRIQIVTILLALLASAVLMLVPVRTYLTSGPFIISLIYGQVVATVDMHLPLLLFNTCALISPVLMMFAAIFFRCSSRRYLIFAILFVIGSMTLPAWLHEGRGNPIARRLQFLPAVLAIASAVTYRIAAEGRDKAKELAASGLPRPPRKAGPPPPSLNRIRRDDRLQ